MPTFSKKCFFVCLALLALDDQQHGLLAFTIPSTTTATTKSPCTLRSFRPLFAGKGFGSPSSPASPRKETFNEESDRTEENPFAEQNMGQQALERMRRERAEKRDAELRKVKEVRSVDEFVKDDPTAAAIPEKVAMRMGSRMLPFVGVPLFGTMGAFFAFWYFATYQNMEFQPGMVAATTLGILAMGLVGITYAVMSASWDPDREGTALGFEEFSRNVDNLKEGLSRSRENAVVRERMAGMSEDEIQAAIRELDKRDEKKKKQRSGLEEIEALKTTGDDSWNP